MSSDEDKAKRKVKATVNAFDKRWGVETKPKRPARNPGDLLNQLGKFNA